jgi:hypothetical protein
VIPSNVCSWLFQPNQPTPLRSFTFAPAGRKNWQLKLAFQPDSSVRQLPAFTIFVRVMPDMIPSCVINRFNR